MACTKTSWGTYVHHPTGHMADDDRPRRAVLDGVAMEGCSGLRCGQCLV